MTTNNNRYFAIIFYAGGLALMLAVTLFLLTGCNAVKKEARKSDKALKHIQKAERVQPNELAKWCAKRYNPIDSVYESLDSVIVYLPGEPVFAEVDCDSILKAQGAANQSAPAKVKVKCPPCDSTKIISVYSKRFQQAANTAALDSMGAYYEKLLAAKDAELKELSAENNKLKERNRIQLYAIIILAAYTLLRWILRIWGVKLP